MDDHTGPPRHFTLKIKVRRFSSCNEWGIIKRAVCKYDDETFREDFDLTPELWFDRTSGENDPSVSVGLISRFWRSTLLNSIELRCLASVRAASRRKMLPQSLEYSSDMDTAVEEKHGFLMLGFDKYIGRSYLLNNASEFLPNDILTLCLDIDYKIKRRYWNSMGLEDFGNLGCCVNADGKFCIHMDSAFGQKLIEWSSVFQRMMKTPMLESTTRLLPLLPEKRYFFQLLHHISKENDNIISTVDGISKFYVFADMYDMQIIMQLCRDFMTSILRAIHSEEDFYHVSKYIHIISELAETFIMDEGLREILAMYTNIERKLQGGEAELEGFNSSNAETEWACEYKGEHFQFSKAKNNLGLQMDFFK